MVQVQVGVGRVVVHLFDTGFLPFPLAKGFCFVVIDFHRPVPRHLHFLGHQSQVPPILPAPERWMPGLGELAPGATFFTPEPVFLVTASFNKRQEFLIADQILTGPELIALGFMFALFIVPAVVGVIVGFAD